jgi:hypothetical protein
MPSSFSPNLRIELIGNGEQAGNWGSTTNTNLGTLVEDAISGYETVSVTTANQAFTYADGAADQARNAMIELTTTTGAAFAVYAPPSPKSYIIFNASAHAATIYNSTVAGNTTAAGTGVVVPAGKSLAVFTDGSDFKVVATSEFAGTLAVANGGTGAASLTANNVVLGNDTSAVQFVAPGTTGNVLTSDGTTWTSAAIPISSTAQAEEGTNNTTLITPLRMREGFNASGDAPVYACRAWVNFIGNATPPTILGSGNVATVVRNATGDFTITFTEAMQDSNYAAAISSSNVIIELEPNGTTASALGVKVEGLSGAASDPSRAHVAVFR